LFAQGNDTEFSIQVDGLAVKGGVTKYVAGKYECIVENPAGISTRTINVSVTDATKTIVWLSVGGVLVVLCLLVLLALFWRRIQKQKVCYSGLSILLSILLDSYTHLLLFLIIIPQAMLRNLTEDEIHEFLYGKPDALDATTDTNRQGHCLAYNRDYEFPRDFLLFSKPTKSTPEPCFIIHIL